MKKVAIIMAFALAGCGLTAEEQMKARLDNATQRYMAAKKICKENGNFKEHEMDECATALVKSQSEADSIQEIEQQQSSAALAQMGAAMLAANAARPAPSLNCTSSRLGNFVNTNCY
jgi:ABC-type nitrate/sulfonate/bicarbonate transport system substrate-binding protein